MKKLFLILWLLSLAPLASGQGPAPRSGSLPKNASGAFGAANVSEVGTQLKIADDIHSKGPNPHADIMLFGGYLGSFTPPTLSCNTTRSSANISCTGGVNDFLVGHGVSIPGAGAAPTVATPSAAVGVFSMTINTSNLATITTAKSVSYTNGTSIVASGMADSSLNGTYSNVQMSGYGVFTASFRHAACGPCNFGSGVFVASTPGAVTPIEQAGGSTVYNYKVVARDFNFALSAASQPFTTTVGVATLGLRSYTIARNGCVTSGGRTTITTTAAHNIPNLANIEFNVALDTTGTPQLEGQFVTVTTTSTTVVMNTQSFPNGTYCPSGGTLQVMAKNLVQWIPQPGLTTGHWIYRCIGPLATTCAANSAYSRLAAVVGTESAFVDWGQTPSSFGPADAAYVPATPPTTPVNGILGTTITAINGTTVTLANAPGASLTRATVLHDNAEAIMAACNLFTTAGAEILAPGLGGIVINSPLNLKNCAATGLRISFAAQVQINETIIPKSGTNFSGAPTGTSGAGSSFQTNFQTNVQVAAYPGFLLSPIGTLQNVSFHNLNISGYSSYGNDIYFDQDTAGNNVTTTTFENTSVTGTVGSQPMRIGGGFGLYVTGGFWGVSGASRGSWGYPPEVLDTVNRGFGQNSQQLGAIWNFTDTNFGGGEVYWDAAGLLLSNQASDIIFTQPLLESGTCPFFHFNTGNNLTYGVTITDPTYADPIGGLGVPVIELGNSRVTAFKVSTTGINVCATGNQPLFAAMASTSVLVENPACLYLGLAETTETFPGGLILSNTSLSIGGAGQAAYAMSAPAAPEVAISGSSGPGANTYYYSVVAIDVNGRGSPVSQNSPPITVNGSQGVLVTLPSYVVGQVATTICRSTTVGYASGVCGTPNAGYQITGTTFLDNGSFFPSVSANSYGGAGASILGGAGLSSSTWVMPGSAGSKASLSGLFSANRMQLLPDVSGTIVASSYINSAFDNAIRANGAIGSNWRVIGGGLNIASNAFQGARAGTQNFANWSANTFSKYGQFGEVTVLTMNGTTDYIGAAVLVNGDNFYSCIENTTALAIQKNSAGTITNLQLGTITGVPGDILRVEVVEPSGTITCYRNGAVALTATDTTFSSGSPGLVMVGNVARSKNWTGGNLHPIAQEDTEQEWTKPQHFLGGSFNRKIDWSALTTAIAANTVILTAPAPGAYTLSAALSCHTAVETATVTLTYSWNDPSGAPQSVTTGAATCTTLGSASRVAVTDQFNVNAGAAVTYATTIAHSPSYDLSIKIDGPY
jgi:hypothetical protein